MLVARSPPMSPERDRGLGPGRPVPLPDSAQVPRSNLLKTLAIAAQLALFLFVIERRFELESPAFREIARLAAAGFLVHALLPARFRLAFFALLSISGVLLVMGPVAGGWVLGLGLAILGICHLPLRFGSRVAVLLLAGAVLAAARTKVFAVPWSGAVWPVLGAMFMFRVIVYVYDLRHVKEPVSIWHRVSYFFLLPNVCFPLFPVVDWRTFLRTYQADSHRVSQKGMQWMFRGLVHLILYRLIYLHVTIPMSQVGDVGQLGRFLVANYLLYLRISGQFHLIIGMLGLFGFDLPETNRLYLLASSFSDYWRRINIYWKDFMVKVFYYPAFFRLRNLGPTRGMVLATAFVFVVTWALHSYQWFWLRGSFPVTLPDILFWGLIGLFVIISSLREAKAGRTRTLGTKVWTLPESFALALRTTGMFVTICVIWSLWTAGSLASWSALWIFGEPGWTKGWQAVVGFLAAAIVGGTLVRLWIGRVPALRVAGPTLDFSRSVLVTGGALLLIAGVGSRRVYGHFDSEIADVITSLRTQRLNEGDLALLTRGYYEDLLGLDRVNTELWEVYMKEPAGWYGDESIMYRPTGDFLGREHVPLAESKAKDIPVIFNRWGMRSADCEKEKPPHTLRIALMGTSYAVGLGIPVDSTWVGLTEARLNREHPSPTYERAEILNLSVGGYRTAQRLYAMETKAFEFHPDVVFFLAHENDLTSLKDISDAVREGRPLPYLPLAEMAAMAGVGPGTPEAVAERRLQRIGADLVGWTYKRAVQSCREHGAVPVWLFLRTTNEGDWRKPHDVLRRLADEAGFVPLDLGDTYGNTPLRSLFLAEWDHHPKVFGHVMIADRLWGEILEHPEIFASASTSATAPSAGETAAASAIPESKESPQ